MMTTHAIDCDLDEDCSCGAGLDEDDYYSSFTMPEQTDPSTPTDNQTPPAPAPEPTPEPSLVDLAHAVLDAHDAHTAALAQSNASAAKAETDRKAESDALQVLGGARQALINAANRIQS